MHYYKIRPQQDVASLIGVNEFWADFAEHQAGRAGKPFISANVALVGAAPQLSARLCALAVLDLPFQVCCFMQHSLQLTHAHQAVEVAEVTVSEGKLRYRAKGAGLIMFHKDLSVVEAPAVTTVMVGQNYFDPEDRWRRERGQQVRATVR